MGLGEGWGPWRRAGKVVGRGGGVVRVLWSWAVKPVRRRIRRDIVVVVVSVDALRFGGLAWEEEEEEGEEEECWRPFSGSEEGRANGSWVCVSDQATEKGWEVQRPMVGRVR